MPADYEMLASAAALPIASSALIYIPGILAPDWGWFALIPAIIAANLASVAAPKAGGSIATAGVSFAWITAILLTLAWARAFEGSLGDVDMSENLTHGVMGLGIVSSVVTMGLLAKTASDMAKAPAPKATPESVRGKKIALSVGNGILGLFVVYFVGVWFMGNRHLFIKSVSPRDEARTEVMRTLGDLANVNSGYADQYVQLRSNKFSKSAWKDYVSEDEAREAGFTIVE